MAPLLIDGRDLIKLGFITVLVTILVFAGGFFFGHRQAATFYQAGSDVQSLPLPVNEMLVESVAESQLPSKIQAGENIDVDQPSITILANNTMTATVVSSQNKKQSALRKAESDELELVTKESASRTKNAQHESHREIKKVANADDALIVSTFTSAELSKIKYTVQVGMYGRLFNAENMVKTLQSQQYDAYVTDYTNKKNEIRYNVRFGYFADKKSATATLKKFKARQQGDGYLVKFSADNIVNVAGARDIEQSIEVPESRNKTVKKLRPATVPTDIVADKISQADIFQTDSLSHTLVTTN